VAKARLRLGLIYYNEEKDESALSSYKAIITEYPGTEEAKEALLAIKNIYVDAGTGEEYLTYLKSLPFASVSANAQDSISYQSANTRYLKADYDNAIAGFNSYLTKFPEGIFSTEAHANRAECYLKVVKDDAALIDFNFIIEKNKTTYLERALLLAARINFRNKEYTKAAAQFKQLEEVAEYKENYAEAIGTAMRAYMNLNDTIATAAYANKIIAYEKSASDDINLAHLYLGKLYYKQNNRKAAATEFEIVTKNTKTAVGAEAKYYLAQILFDEAQYLPAQQACFDLSNQVPSYEYWVAKGFILLADTYHKLGNDFQAKSTLQSIIDEYEGTDDIVTEAKSKLESFLISK
jgi:TolA-binding protein